MDKVGILGNIYMPVHYAMVHYHFDDDIITPCLSSCLYANNYLLSTYLIFVQVVIVHVPASFTKSSHAYHACCYGDAARVTSMHAGALPARALPYIYNAGVRMLLWRAGMLHQRIYLSERKRYMELL